MCTQASSRREAAGYSSWSMWFFLIVSWISFSAWGSIQVVTNDARFSVSRRSSISSVFSSSYAESASMPEVGNTMGSMCCRNGFLA
jgi:hypothetical protein